MTTTTLTDRYVDAAMRTVPEAQRDDLAAELRGSIDDQIDARVAEGEERTDAERAVLTDLGDPDKLAAGYTERPLWLIGPRYFLEWWRLLKLLLWIVLPCAAFGIALAQVLAGAGIGEVIGTIVPVLISVTVHLGFWTVLVFAVVERTSRRDAKTPFLPWTVDQLPEPRTRGAGFGDLIASLVFLLFAAGAILWDLLIGFVPSEPGLSFLDPGLWPTWIIGLFVLMALEAAFAVIVYAVGRWTPWLAVVNGILNIAIAVPALWLLSQGRLINPDYFPTIIPGESGAEVGLIVSTLVGFVIAGAAIWDTIDGGLKAVRARRG
ncbi:permease prefix domain 1-containing protein [Microbacterium sp. CFBP9034]|uniref:permease prefix domain 1-containing protein n=1 Tax=Microbacterium sp. CFBP9034 TaxID=3096540 RepID=UPI002A6AC127|nr:permease prefix domain 1-containing protein [Microbacterium sp. CFBP9034]MDY0908749.1 permease prefix domain 1-containing protein [Microbacterium sp. CFBP9034]